MSNNVFLSANGAVVRLAETLGPGPGPEVHFKREDMMPETDWLNEEVFKKLQKLPGPPDVAVPGDDDL